MGILSGTIVVAFGLSLIGFAVVIAVKPPLAERFLHLFASSARAHYTEQVLRLVVGTALVLFSPSMWYSIPFQVLGWLIAVTAAGLLLLPWRWHHRFAGWAIRVAIRHLKLYGVGAFALGAFILYSVSRYAFQ